MNTERSCMGAPAALGTGCLFAIAVDATEPCGGFGECRVLVEINSTDGDIGFHWLADAEGLVGTTILDPSGRRIFSNAAQGALLAQTLTETFGESSEPVCQRWLADDPDDEVVTLTQFVRRFPPGAYRVRATDADGETLVGRTPLTYWLPAAPRNVAYSGGVITWDAGVSLGACASRDQLWQLVGSGVLPVHPMNVPVAEWEVTFELEDGSQRSFSVRLPARGVNAQMSITVPAEFLASIRPDTPAKIEVGAIGGRLEIGDDDNATFTELTGLCLKRRNGCRDQE
jgi:hypothetical protein